MLSAVAARKAAKAAAESSATPSSKPPSPPPPRSPSPLLTKLKNGQTSGTPKSNEKPTSKRKTRVASNAEPSTKKKVKVSHPPSKSDQNVRYFNSNDSANAGNGDFADEPLDASSESDSSSGEDIQIETGITQQVGLMSISAAKTKRAWSPSRPLVDSSEDEEPGPSGAFDPASYAAPSTSKKFEPTPLSTFRPVLNHNVYIVQENENDSSGTAAILVLEENDTIAVIGTYSFRVLQGGISILGVTLSSSDTNHSLFAPRSSPIPVLSWAATDRPGSCTYPIPPAIREKPNSTAILIKHTDTNVEGLGQICKVFENAFKPPRELGAVSSVELPRIYTILHSAKDIHPFVLPKSWEDALGSIQENDHSGISVAPICLVRGPKKSGKSTFARTLVNRLLGRYRRVAFLECDLGQSEFTPGGMVALNIVENYIFGPPFTHPSLPYRAHYAGATSPRSNPSYYLDSIQALLETYKLDLQFPVLNDDPSSGDERVNDAIPLVVNTMGWTKGLGADLNARIEERVEASHVFEINGEEDRGWPQTMHAHHIPQQLIGTPFTQAKVRQHIKVEAISPEMTDTYHTATDHRHLNILSYFHAVFPDVPLSPSSLTSTLPRIRQTTAIRWNTSLPLCARYPYEVDYTQAFDNVYLSGPGYEDVVPSELTRVLNGALVGLISNTSFITQSQLIQPTSLEICTLPYTPGEPPPDPVSSTCHGLALIRGVPSALNSRSPQMHILTPLPTGLLAQSRLLVKGEMELPIWGMLDFRQGEEGGVAGVERGHVPYLQWGKGEGIGSEKRRVRRNLMRKGQM